MPEPSLEQPDITRLYRVENPNMPIRPAGATFHPDLIGQWFTNQPETIPNYVRKAAKTGGRYSAVVEGVQLVVAEVPSAELDRYHVSNHPVAARMDVENDNYLIQADAPVDRHIVPIDDLLAGGLAENLGNTNNLNEVRQRIFVRLGELSLL